MHNLNPIDDINERIEAEGKFSEEEIEDFKEFVLDHYYEIPYGPHQVTLDEFEVENFNNISRPKSIDFEDRNAIIYGRNALGKTSLLKSIQFNLLGLPTDRQTHGMTGLITSGKKRMVSKGRWKIDEEKHLLIRNLLQSGRGGKLSEYDEPLLLKNPDENNIPYDRHNQSSEVFERFGVLPLINRGYEPYELMSLFFLMARNFLHFLDWNKSTEVIDTLFGVYLTNVVNAVDDKREKEAIIPDASARAPSQLELKEVELAETQEELSMLRERQERLQTEIADKIESLEALRQISTAEDQLDELRSRKSTLRSKLADLKSQRAESVSELAKTKRLIERYEDSELVDDIGALGDELRDLMTVPDRCPVCTNSVDGAQRKQLLHEGHCPLCDKEMPDDRMRKEQEYQADDSLLQRREQQQQELDELKVQKDELEYDIEEYEERIESTEQDISAIEQRISDSDFDEIISERESLEREVRELRQESVNAEVRIERLESVVADLKREVWANEHLVDILEERKRKKEVLDRLSGIVETVRKEQRKKLKKTIADEMVNVLDFFTTGNFANATSVSFKNDENYQFVVHTPEREYDSAKADREAAEATLHALVFHTAVLKLLSKRDNSFPLRLFVIDSPYSNDIDPHNEEDVTSLITELPSYLESYQTIVSMAEPDDERMELFSNNGIQLLNFAEI
ncbi:hypothetical protein [Natrialba sp. PRR66]|uniref:hypothetical protein n=1 Tax=Natrialba sp. PRR66 TaxID=3098146 RepID=UPI002B1DEA4E|nr:hypothetical protein [Natrialba sp. PRR66]